MDGFGLPGPHPESSGNNISRHCYVAAASPDGFDIATYHSRQEVTECLPPLFWILNELIKK